MFALAIVTVLAAGALAAFALKRNARWAAAASCALALALAAAAPFVALDDTLVLGSAPLLAIDRTSCPWVISAALVALAVLVAGPRRALSGAHIVELLVLTAATEVVLTAQNLVLLALAWTLALAPAAIRAGQKDDPAASRAYALLALGATIPFLGAAIVLGWRGVSAGLASPFDLHALAQLHSTSGEQVALFAAIAVACAIRMGLVPFHAWQPVLLERGPVGVAALFAGVGTGAWVLARVAVPLLPHGHAPVLPWIAVAGAVSAVAGGLLAITPVELGRTIGYVAVSQAGVAAIGASAGAGEGARLACLGAGLATATLVLLVRALEARTGTQDVRGLGGLVASAPIAAGLVLAAGLAVIGFPGSLGYVGQELLLRSVLTAHPALGAAILAGITLDAIALFRILTRAMFARPAGRARAEGPLPIDDLVPRERLVVLLLLAAIVAGGLAPGWLRDPHPPPSHIGGTRLAPAPSWG